MSDYWFNATSEMITQHCGETCTDVSMPHSLPYTLTKDRKLTSALDTTATWHHDQNHEHWIKVDLGGQHYIKNIRGKLNATTNIKHVIFYVTNDVSDYGTPVLDVENWQDGTPDYYEVVTYPCIPKLGRYILILIHTTTHASNYLRWG